ncbi:MAG: CoA ester lyase [Chloroflexi bacterium]|nr:CoA ester lyase [Chloroflexota bacterium]
MPPRRAMLYMPGSDRHKIEKATTLGVDSVCMDLEDGVALNRKEEARETVAKALQELDFGSTERLVRINTVGSGLEAKDLEALIAAKPDGVVVPKVAWAKDIGWVSAKLRKLEGKHGLEHGSIYILAIVESAMGIVNLKEIAQADKRLKALIFGALDLAGDMGAKLTPEANEVLYARSALVTHAAAFGLDAIDMVAVDFKDMAALKKEANQGAQMGYAGKQIIHPAQIELVQAAFTPTEDEIAEARRIVQAHAKHQEEGKGSFALDGKMVDMPVVRSAEKVLERAGVNNR